MPVVIIIAIVAVVAVVAYLGYKAEKKRREELAALAAELGWRFDPTRDRDHDDEYAHFEIFRRGHSRAAHNTMTGTIDALGTSCAAKMGDFIYKVTRSDGKRTTTHTYRFSYFILHLPHRVPDLLIRPEGMFDKLAGVFGFDDIDFESSEFSRRFFVKSPDKRFAYDVVHPRMMEYLLQGAPCVDIEQSRCCLSDGRRRWTAAEFRSTIAWLEAFFENWPRHVVAELTAGRPG